MAINDKYTLPKMVRKIPQMEDLLQAEQTVINLICDYIENLKKELNVNSSTELLSRHEKIFDLTSDVGESIEERRAKIIAKLNARGMTTVESIEEIAKILTECNCFVTENYEDYSFVINVKHLSSEETGKLKHLLVRVDEVKPAHLNCTIHLVYNTYGSLGRYTHGQLARFRHIELREKDLDAEYIIE